MTEDEMVGWHHRLNGHEFEQAPAIGDGQGSLACCSPGTVKPSPAPQFRSVNPLALSLLHGPALTSRHDHWKNHSFDYMDLCWPSDMSAFQFTV